MTDRDGMKYLTVRDLAAFLAELPADYRLMPNAVGNLLVQAADENEIGYIDFLHGSVEIY